MSNTTASSSSSSSPATISVERTKNVALASSMATVFSKTILHPLDTLKCRFQILALYTSPVHTSVSPPPPPLETEGIRHWRDGNKKWRKNGAVNEKEGRSHAFQWHRMQQVRDQFRGKWRIRDLYGGLPPKLVCYVPYQSIYMVTYDRSLAYYQTMASPPSSSSSSVPPRTDARPREGIAHTVDVVGSPPSPPPAWCTILAAITAELMGCTIRVPMEATKVWVQSTVSPHSFAAFQHFGHASPTGGGGGGGTVVRRRWRARFFGASSSPSSSFSCGVALDRLRALWVPQTLLHDIPYSICQWVAYEALKVWVTTVAGEGDGAPPPPSPPQQKKKTKNKKDNNGGGRPSAMTLEIDTTAPHSPTSTPSSHSIAGRGNVCGSASASASSAVLSTSPPHHLFLSPLSRDGRQGTSVEEENGAMAASYSSSGTEPCPPCREALAHDPPTIPPLTAVSSALPWSSFSFFLRTSFAGGAAALIASVLTIPLDNIRTRALVWEGQRATCGLPPSPPPPLQGKNDRRPPRMPHPRSCIGEDATRRGGAPPRPPFLLRRSIWKEVVRPVYMTEGMRGFFRGGGWRVLWVTTNMALYFPIFEWLKLQL